MKNKEKGQSLVELMIAMGLFALSAAAITLLVLDSYVAVRAGQEKTRAVFLAEEGMEAARAIRDNNWSNLTVGDHGIVVSSNRWYFSGTQEDISSKLKNGTRKITVEQVDTDRKKVTSLVSWDFSETRSQEVSLVSYFSNWRQSVNPTSCPEHCLFRNYAGGICRSTSAQCTANGEIYSSRGNTYCAAPNRRCCCDP
ncbi:MAG: prepilin-type N-terminal cleavage/methylation domain-containing protein [Candidatus Paceibacterota bacterium]|jgi:Tfp pilus assembly protein PilV